MKKQYPARLGAYVLASLLVLMLAAAASLPISAAEPWDGTTLATSFAGGDGSESDPYLISNGAELAYLASVVNEGENCKDTYFKLSGDIPLGGNPWTPIGTYQTKTELFAGSLDGGGYRISNFYCNVTTIYAGLFGYAKGATIKNLTVEGGECSGMLNTGVIVAYAEGGTKIINCVSDVGLVSGEQVGGIAGRIGLNPGNLILGCVNYSTVQATGTTTYAFAAGIASVAGGTVIAYCANYGDISATNLVDYVTVGGIVGMQGADKLEATITYCFNSGNITGVSESVAKQPKMSVGGIVGRANHITFGEISHCASIGEYSSNYAGQSGAIFGYNVYAGIIEDCYTDNDVKFGTDKSTFFSGDEAIVLAADAIRGEAALTNMKLDPALFTAVPGKLPTINIDAAVESYFANLTDPGDDPVDPDGDPTDPGDTTPAGSGSDTTTPPPSKGEDSTTKGDTTKGGCGSIIAAPALLMLCGAGTLLIRRRRGE